MASHGPFQVTDKDVAQLNDQQLVRLVRDLLHAEAHAAEIPLSAVQLSLRINVPDGGEDGRIEWSGGPSSTNFIPRRFTVFQMKAESLSLSKVAEEPIDGVGKSDPVKPAVKAVIAQEGAYVLVTNKTNLITPSKAKKSKAIAGKKRARNLPRRSNSRNSTN